MPFISTYDVVRVVRLENPDRPYDGTEGVSRPPRIGDVGTVVFEDGGDLFQVECVDNEGMTVWLADFDKSEIESLQGQPIDWSELPALALQIAESVRIGMTRDEVVSILGDAEDFGPVPRSQSKATIFKYGDVELHFGDDIRGTLARVYMEVNQMGVTLLE